MQAPEAPVTQITILKPESNPEIIEEPDEPDYQMSGDEMNRLMISAFDEIHQKISSSENF